MKFLFIIPALILVIACETGCINLRFVTIMNEQKETVQAVFGVPSGSSNRPAVIFNHGSSVRYGGYAAGMYVNDYVKALNEQGYVAIAPLRTGFGKEATFDRGRLTGTPEQWTEVIAYGLRVVGAARRFLAEWAGVNQVAIAIMGYSEGGNVSLWSAIETLGYRAVVLLSPAAIPSSPRYRLRAATSERLLRRINAPVFLAVASDDFKGVREATSEALIPNLKKLNPAFRYRDDYLGDHNSFKRVRNDFWGDVAAFLKEHLK